MESLSITNNDKEINFEGAWDEVDTSKANLKTFSHLIALILNKNSVEGLRVSKIVKETKFQGVWGHLESKQVSRENYSQIN